MHLEKVTGKNVVNTYNRAPEEGEAIFVSKYLVLGAFGNKGKLTFLVSVSKDDSFDIHHDHIQ
jgi:hypothetical protein